MDRDNVKQVFKIIKSVYPQFEVSTDKLNVWANLMRDQEAETVISNTKSYVLNNKFPPTIADIKQNKVASRDKNFVDKVKQWERDAVGFKPRS